MELRALCATFGNLERQELSFMPGLNIIQAPNEAGKSTLSAFLRVMLYGLSTKERGSLADKNRYAPWSGSAMQGRLDLLAGDAAITLTRSTSRANAPMGQFSAVYTGTGESVPSLSAADCGETLLGVPREVFERSAFIRQSGLAVGQSAELERRIAALITTGEEGSVSYSEAAAVLKKQLNARKHNKTGKIPALEAEIASQTAVLEELSRLMEQRRSAEAELEELHQQLSICKAELSAHDSADMQERLRSWKQAQHAWQEADSKASSLRRAMEQAQVPPRSTLEECRSKLLTISQLEIERIHTEARQEEALHALEHFTATCSAVGRPPHSFPLYAGLFFGAALCVFALLSSHLFLTVPGSLILALCAFWAQRRKKAFQQKKEQLLQQHRTLESALQSAAAAAKSAQANYAALAQSLLHLLPVDSIDLAAQYIDDSAKAASVKRSAPLTTPQAICILWVIPLRCNPNSAKSKTSSLPCRKNTTASLWLWRF